MDCNFIITWYPGKANSLLFYGKDGERFREKLVSILSPVNISCVQPSKNDLQSSKPSISPLADLSKDLSFITHLDMSKSSNDLTFKDPHSDVSYLEEPSVPQCSRMEKHSRDGD